MLVQNFTHNNHKDIGSVAENILHAVFPGQDKQGGSTPYSTIVVDNGTHSPQTKELKITSDLI